MGYTDIFFIAWSDSLNRESDIMLETSLITATRDHFDRRARRTRTHFIPPPDARNNSIIALFMGRTITYFSGSKLASVVKWYNNIGEYCICRL